MDSQKLSRRDFLTKASAGAGTAAVTLAVPEVLRASSQHELATLIDLSKCIGCEECVYACKESNAHKFPEPQKPFPKMFPRRVKVSDWSDKRDVTDRLTPYNWLYIQRSYVTHNGQEHEINIPRRCMHCQEPPCAHLCPFGSAHKHDSGITTIDPDLCLGGAKCTAVCPWNIPQRQTGVGPYLDLAPSIAGNGVMYKCDRCIDKLEQGQQPACIEACPQDVQKIGPREEILKEARTLAEKMGGYLYGADENGGTNTIYVSPVPFEKINESIEKGPGKPHLKRVDNTMAKTDKIALALVMAPFVGIAAALGRAYNKIKKFDEVNKDDNRNKNIA